MEKVIEANELTYSYGKNLAVDHISFYVNRSEILGFLGPNGAGKTTTFKMLIGLLKPKEGIAKVLGLDISKEPKKIQRRIGVCFEYTNLYEELSAKENLVLFANLFGIKNFNPYELIEKVGLKGKENDLVKTFSKGMKQRLMVARALVNDPEILFLDEPTQGLDPVSSEEIRNIILEEKKKGKTIFLTTHDMYEADKLSDRVAFINYGKIVALDAPLNLKTKFGKRSLKLKLQKENGEIYEKDIVLDKDDTLENILSTFKQDRVITAHSEEATLEDIFIKITGRGLKE
ncbi:MAG: ABC transporter ATP-binding protein [Caldisericia bacterium]|nr:ABC transporter ATP-binding protein [Caldisericia bacterium]